METRKIKDKTITKAPIEHPMATTAAFDKPEQLPATHLREILQTLAGVEEIETVFPFFWIL